MLSHQDNEMLTRVGPGTPMGSYLRRFWIPVLQAEKLAHADCDPVSIRILGEDLVAFRDSSGAVGLLEALCPHRRAPLVYGRNEEGGLRCLYHGWKFDVNGSCLEMPSEPSESNFCSKIKAVSYPVREQGGVIWAYMGPIDKMPAELPAIEWTLLPETHRKFVVYEQRCNFVQAMEGDLDSSHIGFLHSGTTDKAFPGIGALIFKDRAPRWTLQSNDYGLMAAAQRTVGEGEYLWRVNQWLLPFFTLVANEGGRGGGGMYVPVDDTHTNIWVKRWSFDGEPLSEEDKYSMTKGPAAIVSSIDPDTGRMRASRENNYLQDREVQRYGNSYSGIHGALEQDTAMIEGMGPIMDRTKEHLGKSDAAIIAMRKIFLGEVKALMAGQEPEIVNKPAAYGVHAWTALLDQGKEGFLDNPEVRRLLVSPITGVSGESR